MKNNTILTAIAFDKNGLVPVIVQQYDTGEILMMAWMNQEALEETLISQQMCFWSRSRQSLWRKGGTSGQVQILKELMVDCDGDTLLAKVHQEGVACHTGRRSCFFRTVKDGNLVENQPVKIDPKQLYPAGDE